MRHTTDKSITTSSPIPSTQTNEIVSHDDWPINCENKEQGLYKFFKFLIINSDVLSLKIS